MEGQTAELRDRVERAVKWLVSASASPMEVLRNCQELHDTLAAAAGWNCELPAAQARCSLPDGVAIAPAEAARCILDSARTAAFLRGTRLALRALQKRGDGRRLEVLYAGCGPLAPLAIGLQSRLADADARFWLVDAQPEAVRCAEALVARLGYGERFAPIQCVDAARHDWPLHFDLVIVETMQRALEKEPQVAITAKVARHLRPDGVLVPQCVELDLCFYDPACEHAIDADRLRYARAPLLRLTAASAAELLEHGATAVIEHQHSRALQAMIATRVRVHAEEILEEYASAITLPLMATSLGPIAAGQSVRAEYRAQPMPALRFALE
jgi:hypothetical protein